jgi:hypothetical protein
MRIVFNSDRLNKEKSKVLFFGVVYNISPVNNKLADPGKIINQS